ncbi:hypothetical protein G5S35_01095 [Paraburkholderia tropica]|uniref:hypothetical protein n=1 Tax=Paraburkholderia tropica TaxID=92647 RepID=UPI001601E905|nr:hypothetical protein [Paraburkholderia tropica]QNB10295.1 hypothetical protein G5S35_01095 [Paraburkholderia tropica]
MEIYSLGEKMNPTIYEQFGNDQGRFDQLNNLLSNRGWIYQYDPCCSLQPDALRSLEREDFFLLWDQFYPDQTRPKYTLDIEAFKAKDMDWKYFLVDRVQYPDSNSLKRALTTAKQL